MSRRPSIAITLASLCLAFCSAVASGTPAHAQDLTQPGLTAHIVNSPSNPSTHSIQKPPHNIGDRTATAFQLTTNASMNISWWVTADDSGNNAQIVVDVLGQNFPADGDPLVGFYLLGFYCDAGPCPNPTQFVQDDSGNLCAQTICAHKLFAGDIQVAQRSTEPCALPCRRPVPGTFEFVYSFPPDTDPLQWGVPVSINVYAEAFPFGEAVAAAVQTDFCQGCQAAPLGGCPPNTVPDQNGNCVPFGGPSFPGTNGATITRRASAFGHPSVVRAGPAANIQGGLGSAHT